MKTILLIFSFIALNASGFANNNFAFGNDSTFVKDTDSTKYGINFNHADVMPSYPGGVVEMLKFLSFNLKYPAVAKKNKLEGKVKVKFYIDIDGYVKEPFILNDGVGGGAAEEAIRLVSSMPKWTPGTQGGKPVKVYYVLPVTFKLK